MSRKGYVRRKPLAGGGLCVSLRIVFMKVPISYAFIAACFLFQAPLALGATGQGACSWHGGVNCSAGSDYDGSVICKDGWRDSSVGYRDVCMDSCSSGYTPEYLQTLLKCYSDRNAQSRILDLQRNALVNARFNGVYTQTPEQLQALTEEQKKAIQSRDNNQLMVLLSEVTALMDSNKNACQTVEDLKPVFCKDFLRSISPACPSNASLINNACTCDVGYTWNGNACVTYMQACQASFGVNSYGVLGRDGKADCYCIEGFQWNSARTNCEPTPTCSQNATLVKGDCVCNTGFKWNTQRTACEGDVPSFSVASSSAAAVPAAVVWAPKSKADMLRCRVVGNKSNKLYYLQGSKFVKSASHAGKICFKDEIEAKKAKYKKAKT